MTGSPDGQGGASTDDVATAALSLLATPVNALVVRSLTTESRGLPELRRAAGSPPQTTVRGYLRNLIQHRVVERCGDAGPARSRFRLTDTGQELTRVAAALEAWLAGAPDDPPALGTTAAKSVISALVEGWSTGIVGALSGQALALTELDPMIPSISYPSLERRLAALRHEGLVQARQSAGRTVPYCASDWLRRAAGPLLTAARWKHLCSGGAWSSAATVAAGFRLALPLVEPPSHLEGFCRLVIESDDDDARSERRRASVIALVRRGAVEAPPPGLDATDASALGGESGWFAAVIDNDLLHLRFSGERQLARSVAEGLHVGLFSSPPTLHS